MNLRSDHTLRCRNAQAAVETRWPGEKILRLIPCSSAAPITAILGFLYVYVTSASKISLAWRDLSCNFGLWAERLIRSRRSGGCGCENRTAGFHFQQC